MTRQSNVPAFGEHEPLRRETVKETGGAGNIETRHTNYWKVCNIIERSSPHPQTLFKFTSCNVENHVNLLFSGSFTPTVEANGCIRGFVAITVSAQLDYELNRGTSGEFADFEEAVAAK